MVINVTRQVCLGIHPEEHSVAALLLQRVDPLQEQLLRHLGIRRGPLFVRRDQGNKTTAEVA
jgi:hypothetical protein